MPSGWGFWQAGMAGAAEAGAGGGEAGADEGGSAGLDAQAGAGATAGEAGTADDAGSGGVAGDSSLETELEIAPPTLGAGKTYVPFTGKLRASGAAHYDWSLASGVLPAGLTLQGAQSATVTIAGTPTEAGQFPISLSVTDGSATKTVDVTLVITHSALFLSDRNVDGRERAVHRRDWRGTAAAPVRLNASIAVGRRRLELRVVARTAAKCCTSQRSLRAERRSFGWLRWRRRVRLSV